MQAAKEKVVSINYELKDDQGNVIDSSEGRAPLAYLHGAGNIVVGLERELEGKSAGDSFEVCVAPADGYGERMDELVQPVPRENFPDPGEVTVGSQFQAQTPDGPRLITVVGVDEQNVTIDANHPLAGQSLNFTGEVVDIRDPTAEELQHGHPHGPGGHEH
ncbi:MAG: peptidylprolyl isomerase [Planctomycetaceae bacterium]|nr:peptidylprolyl isomerase [Planctomycetaceae bacterium]